MRNNQKGMTGLGILCVLSLVVVIGLAGFKVTPIYLEIFRIDAIMNDIEDQLTNNSKLDANLIRGTLSRRLDIESIYGVSVKDFEVKRSSKGYAVVLEYEPETHYFANLYLTVKYAKRVEIYK